MKLKSCSFESLNKLLTNLSTTNRSLAAGLLLFVVGDRAVAGGKNSLFKEGKSLIFWEGLLEKRACEVQLPTGFIKVKSRGMNIKPHQIVILFASNKI